MSRTLTLRPFAKINLTLRVGARREDGFHDVRTLLQSVALSDRLTIAARRGPFRLVARSPGMPVDRSNLVWRAADLLWRALGRPGEARDAGVKLEKTIPIAAGLGGGSADAAAALCGLNIIWGGRLPRRELGQLAAQLGSDVPFFLLGGTALGAGRGDEIYPVDDISSLGVVLIKPSFGVSAADAYRWLDEDRAHGLSDIAASARCQVDVGWPNGPVIVRNDLQAPVARRHPAIAETIDVALGAGAHAAAMTGSGSAVFALFPPSMLRRAARQFQRPDWLVLVTRTLSRRDATRRMGL